jgi:hypothetical protein
MEDVQKTDYRWIERAALLSDRRMVRGKFFLKDDIQAENKWRSQFNNTDIFYGVCQHTNPDSESAFIVPIFADIDSESDLPGARESAIILCQMIIDRIKVPQDQLEIYFSGHKGFHVLVPCEVFRPIYLPGVFALYKRIAEKAEQAGVKHIDKGVYTHQRIFRCSNSRHGKSGLFKIPLTFEGLRDTSIEGILKIARSPCPENTFVTPRFCEGPAEWYRRVIEWFENNKKLSSNQKINTKFRKGWRMTHCVKTIEAAVVPDGIRHQLYVSLARYFGYLNMHPDEMLERLEAIDKRNPIRDPDSIERAVEFGCEHPGFPGCDDEVLQRYCCKADCFYARLKGVAGRK